ncbi:MAG: acyl-CoA dehydratase activase [Planctomycetota bacterium]
MSDRTYIGIDVGSISMNLVVIDDHGEVVYEDYRRVGGDPISVVQNSLRELYGELPAAAEIAGAGVTGSGREVVGAMVGADVVKNEITAHARATIHLHPGVRTIFEIGGQDSKMTVVRDQVVEDFAMNLVCAAGTGSFLDSQARRLGLSVEQLSEKAVQSEDPTNIAGRCTVFAETDMIHKQQMGHRQEDILMGLCHAMVRNFLSNVCSGKEIRPPIVLQGGISANQGIRRAFQEELDCDLIIPRYNMVMGAYGAALIARISPGSSTDFKGRSICDRPIVTDSFQCEDCSNQCEIVEILDGDEVVGRSGGRCRKWEQR